MLALSGVFVSKATSIPSGHAWLVLIVFTLAKKVSS